MSKEELLCPNCEQLLENYPIFYRKDGELCCTKDGFHCKNCNKYFMFPKEWYVREKFDNNIKMNTRIYRIK